MSRRTRTNLLLTCAAFFAGVGAAILWYREPMAPLTRELLAAARQRWRDAGVSSYAIRYRMHGSEYAIQCRNGIVEQASVDDRPPSATDLNAYSVDGLFDTLEQELDNLSDPTGPFAGHAGTVMMRVRFNPKFGYPERYLRSSGGHGRGASIEMVVFTIQD